MATIEELLEDFPPEVGKLTLETRALVRSVMPDAVEKVNLGWKNVIFSTGPSMRSTVFVINPLRERVNLNIGEATTLEDPDHLLEGTGKGIRHVKIHDSSVLARPELRRLLEAAATRARS